MYTPAAPPGPCACLLAQPWISARPRPSLQAFGAGPAGIWWWWAVQRLESGSHVPIQTGRARWLPQGHRPQLLMADIPEDLMLEVILWPTRSPEHAFTPSQQHSRGLARAGQRAEPCGFLWILDHTCLVPVGAGPDACLFRRMASTVAWEARSFSSRARCWS